MTMMTDDNPNNIPFVVYEKETTRIPFRIPGGSGKVFKSEGAAKAAITRGLKKGALSPEKEYCVARADVFTNDIEKMVERTNLMSKKKYWESINTPNYCSPASETYWSM
jgi:hypothetical protein